VESARFKVHGARCKVGDAGTGSNSGIRKCYSYY